MLTTTQTKRDQFCRSCFFSLQVFQKDLFQHEADVLVSFTDESLSARTMKLRGIIFNCGMQYKHMGIRSGCASVIEHARQILLPLAAGPQLNAELKSIPSSRVRVGSVLLTGAGNITSVRAIAHLVLSFSKTQPSPARAGELGSAISK